MHSKKMREIGVCARGLICGQLYQSYKYSRALQYVQYCTVPTPTRPHAHTGIFVVDKVLGGGGSTLLQYLLMLEVVSPFGFLGCPLIKYIC